MRFWEDERSEIDLGVNIQPPTGEPDEIALEIVSSKQPPHRPRGIITPSD